MALINNVDGDDISSDPSKPVKIGRSWVSFFDQVFNLLTAFVQSGPSTSRPTTFLWIGRRFFDTTLGVPIYVQSVNPTVWAFSGGGASFAWTGGTTAARPVVPLLYQQYFDTTLGQPIWAKQVSPAIWVNAAGVTV